MGPPVALNSPNSTLDEVDGMLMVGFGAMAVAGKTLVVGTETVVPSNNVAIAVPAAAAATFRVYVRDASFTTSHRQSQLALVLESQVPVMFGPAAENLPGQRTPKCVAISEEAAAGDTTTVRRRAGAAGPGLA